MENKEKTEVAVANDQGQIFTESNVSETVNKEISKDDAFAIFSNYGKESEDIKNTETETIVVDVKVNTPVVTETDDKTPATEIIEKKSYTEEEVENIRKEAEKESRKKYISQVSIKDKELKEAQANYDKLIKSLESKEDGVSVKDAIEARFKAEKAEMELENERVRERDQFYSKNNDVSGDVEFETMLTELRFMHPSITLDMAKKIYMAEKPEKFFKSEQGTMMQMGSAPVINKEVVPSQEDMRKNAMEAFKKLSK